MGFSPEPDPISPAQRRIEAYLDQILAPLVPRLSPVHRDELRRELRAHLWARVDAYREIGMADDNAVTEALRQFGGAEDFLRQWRQEWMKTTSQVTLPEVWQATRLALPLSLSALLLARLPEMLSEYTFQSNRNGPSGWLYDHFDSIEHFSLCLYFLFPIALGLIMRRRTGNSAALGLFAALTIIGLLGCLINFIGEYLWEQQVFLRESIEQITWLAALWIPAACTSAALTGWWGRRSQVRRNSTA